jgi:aspartokinase/homoserine dehydrogenase 1
MKILKFGGTSVANAENIEKVIRVVRDAAKERGRLAVVVSALGGVTDSLLRLASVASLGGRAYEPLFKNVIALHTAALKKLIKSAGKRKNAEAELTQIFLELKNTLEGIALLKDASLRSLDSVMSFGERLSAYIVNQAFESRGLPSGYVDSRTLIKTDDTFGSAHVLIQKTYAAISNHFKKGPRIAVMGGFIASTEEGVTTTLGRGGSDYTASIVGAALNASVIEIWTDVEGVLTADPRKVPSAFLVPVISYEEAGELAHFGAKVIHPKTMQPARLKKVPILIKNTFNPKGVGTLISEKGMKSEFPAKGISSLRNVSLLRVQSNEEEGISGILSRMFDALSRTSVDVLLTSQASHEQSVSIAISDSDVKRAQIAIEREFALELKTKSLSPVSTETGLSVVSIVGEHMKGVPGLSGKFFTTLGREKVNVVAIAQGSSELNISAVISTHQEEVALKELHRTFFENDKQTINLFLIGTGLIGSTLLKFIEESDAPIRIIGAGNSNTMIVDPKGIAPSLVIERLSKGAPIDLEHFVERMTHLNLPRSVFVDCTGDEGIVSWYEAILTAGVAIVTPNKKAASGPSARFKKLKRISEEKNAPFIYETNVGAGLPVVRSIQSLVTGGDEVVKVEAILSGTLSYIFNTFAGTGPFSDIVADAKKKGYTEPDPRDDLSGKDAARKILIIAREIGLELELKDVAVTPLLPPACFRARSIEAFFQVLKKSDALFEKKKSDAKKKGLVLRHIATLEKGKAKLGLVAVGKDHPFYAMSGSDNIVAISTKRYRIPLVIKGAGAGAEVTAGAVFENIRRIFN